MISNILKRAFLLLFFITFPLYMISALRIPAGDLRIPINFILVGLFLVFLSFSLAKKSVNIYFEKNVFLLVGLMALLLFYYLLILSFSPSLSFALDQVLRFLGAIMLLIVGYIISLILIKNKKSLFNYLNLAIIASTIFLFLLIVVYSMIFHSSALGTELGKLETGGRNQMQIYLVILIPFIVYSFLKTKKKYLLLALIIHLIAVFYLNSRGLVISLVIVAFIYLLFYLFKLSYRLNLSKKKIKLILLLILLVALAVISIILLFVYAKLDLSYTANRFLALVGQAQDTGSISVREDLLLTGISLFLQNPVLGGGFGNFIATSGSQGLILATHNDYLLFLTDTGLIGLILFLLIEIYLMILFLKKKLPIYLILPFFVDLLFINAFNFPLFWVLVGLILGVKNEKGN